MLALNTFIDYFIKTPISGDRGGQRQHSRLWRRLTNLDFTPLLARVASVLPAGPHVDLDVGTAALTVRLAPYRLATTDDPATHAEGCFGLGYRLANAGRWEGSLSATRESIVLYRCLAKNQPKQYTVILLGALAT